MSLQFFINSLNFALSKFEQLVSAPRKHANLQNTCKFGENLSLLRANSLLL